MVSPDTRISQKRQLASLPPGTILSIQTQTWQGRFIQKITGGPASHNVILVEPPDSFKKSGSPSLMIAEQAGGDVRQSRLLTIDEFIDKRAKRGDRISAQVPESRGNVKAMTAWLKDNLEKPYSNFRAAISSLDWTFRKRVTPSPTHSYCSEFVANAARAGEFLKNSNHPCRGFINPNSLMFEITKLGYNKPAPVLNGGLPHIKLSSPPKGPLVKLTDGLLRILCGAIIVIRASFITLCRALSRPFRKAVKTKPLAFSAVGLAASLKLNFHSKATA